MTAARICDGQTLRECPSNCGIDCHFQTTETCPASMGLLPRVTHTGADLTVTEWHQAAQHMPSPQPSTANKKDATMTSTHWLIAAGLVLVLSILAAPWLREHFKKAGQDPAYRTADVAAMDRDVRKLQDLAAKDQRPRVRAGQAPHAAQPAAPTHMQIHVINLAQVRIQAVTTALRDMGRHTTTPNPYRLRSRANAEWSAEYARLIAIGKAVDAEAPATVQTAAHKDPAKATTA